MIKKIAYFILIGLLFICSFRLFSYLYYPALHSDHAITVLMIHYFKLPMDLYFWGQDRMGSLIPLVAQIFLKGFHLSALTSEAITHYLILLLGFFAFAGFFRTNFYKIMFAVFWFFPPMHMIDLTLYTSGISYSLLAICCYLLMVKDEHKFGDSKWKYHALLFVVVLLMITDVWVIDMALISAIILVCVRLVFYLKNQKFRNISFKNPELYYALAGLVAGYFFIRYAKSIMVYRTDYTVISSFEIILKTMKIFSETIFSSFFYNKSEPFTVIYSWMVFLLVVFTVSQWRKIKLAKSTQKWVLFFIVEAIALLVVILGSKFTFLNDVPRRYFTCTYVSLGFVLLQSMENMVIGKKLQLLLKTFLLLTLLIGATGMIYTLKYLYPKTFKSQAEVSAEFKKLGDIGIIANYWNSYVISCVAPDQIKATQNDVTPVRNEMLVDEVFDCEDIYIIKNDWLNNFPDTLKQFGYNLLRNGEPFRMGERDVCKYRKLKINQVFGIENLKSQASETVYDSVLKKGVLLIAPECDSCINRYFVFGPYIPLYRGNYRVRFFIKAENVGDKTIGLMDVSADCGGLQLAKKDLTKKDFIAKGTYNYIDLNFWLPKKYNNMEFRIYYYGNARLYFNHIMLIEK
ncbi:MAG: hypothetical protein WCQ95_14230 [Bacteroidota bacterium]